MSHSKNDDFFSCFGLLHKRSRHHASRRLTLDKLEKRELLAADIELLGGVLTIDGTDQADYVEIRETTVEKRGIAYPAVLVQVTDDRGKLRRDADGVALLKTFRKSTVDSIFAELGSGNDQVVNNTNLPSVLRGGRGDDRLYGGSADDELFGEDGSDRLYGKGGNDLLDGGAANDYLFGNEGHDDLFGKDGADRLYGSGGHDFLDGGASNDYLYGHQGNDLMFGDEGTDRLYGYAGNDLLVGGDQVDYLYGGDDYDRLDGGADWDYLYGQGGGDMVYDDLGTFRLDDGRAFFHLQESWFDMQLADDELRHVARRNWIRDRQLDRDDMLQIFDAARDLHPGLGFTSFAINSLELADLRKIVAHGMTFGMHHHVRILANKVVNSDPANASYQSSVMGDLYSGSSLRQFNQLVGKWFLGTDRPDIGAVNADYRYAAGSLFQNGVEFTDIRQGAAGDCYLLASLASVALQNPQAIEEMFIDNRDGTFTVRFFVDRVGTPSVELDDVDVVDYVTVDRYLPAYGPGHARFAGVGGLVQYASGELWVALVEKAYAQIAESGRLGRTAENTYLGLNGGASANAREHITGQDVRYFVTFDNGEASLGLPGGASTPIETHTALVNAFENGGMITLNSGYGGTHPDVIWGHVYTVVGYDSTTQEFEIFNPWGVLHLQFTAELIAQHFYVMDIGWM